MPETEARPRVKNRHGGAPKGERTFRVKRTVRAAPHPRGSLAPKRRGERQQDAPVGAPPTPRLGGLEDKSITRTQKCAAGTSRRRLFDIVRLDYDERFSDEPRTRHALSRLILRRRRKPPSRRMGRPVPACFETPRIAAKRVEAHVTFCCAAPQHQGRRGRGVRRNEANRAPFVRDRRVARRTNLRVWQTIAGSDPLFPDCYLQ